MFTFEVTPYDSCLYALSIGKVFKRYVNKLELDRILNDFSDYLRYTGRAGILSSANLQKEYSFLFTDDEINEVETLLLVGKEKQAIALPTHLKTSQGEEESKEILLTYRYLDAFKNYWVSGNKDKEYQLLQILSEDLLQIPYADKPHDYDFFRGRLAFHPNHGTTHGLRLMVLLDYYLDTLISYDFEQYSKITLEERSCLKLAMFLFRSGRTNEVGWSGDSTYSSRSAAIFQQIALELNYQFDLVDLISRCFDYHYSLTLDDSIRMSEEKVAKGTLYQQLFKLSHNSDLVRCNTCYKTLHGMLKETFSRLLIDLDVAMQWIDNGLLLAAKLCQSTGSSVHPKQLMEQVSGSSVFGSNRLRVESANDVRCTYERLELISASELSLLGIERRL
ncbi:MAG: SidE phosphodiesterase domain-containing protein [Legionella sp.]|uniref:SidE phosphodiesterase domain-containing protein n=1 Tax=Legionella sp. TaxID=459 RepID=UPI00284C8CC6|nr:SidE phosphodiesterase domain-containing protein [Legionella sp.]